MKIPQALHQFEKYPAIFIASGEYEARFYLAHQGEMNEVKTIKMSPREEAREKQGMVKSSSDATHLGAVSHHGKYIEDLKMKFSRAVHETIHDLLATYPETKDVCFFAPKYVQSRITKKLSKPEMDRLSFSFFTEYTKDSPLRMLEAFQQETETAIMKKRQPSKEAQKILDRPVKKKTLHEIHKAIPLSYEMTLAR